MARLRTDLLAVAALLAAGPVLTAPLTGFGGGTGKMDWYADQVDYERGKVVLRAAQITQGGNTIEADIAEASGLDFQDSNWTFSGNVRLHTEQGNLHADRATVKFVDDRVQTASAHGSPATFDGEVGEGRQPAHGRAQDIDYDVSKGEVQLNGEAWLSDGRNEINGAHIVYNIAAQRVQAEGPSGGGRVSGTIRPRSVPAPVTAPQPAPPEIPAGTPP